ncbi:DUF1829 domain-containing protein [Candidatus Poribacteria bacterium]|nr:DUF1829 domain-containing protein [Candidatus Poribacteria bacterium]
MGKCDAERILKATVQASSSLNLTWPRHSAIQRRSATKPNRDTAEAIAFKWIDTKEVRPPDSRAYALLNMWTRACHKVSSKPCATTMSPPHGPTRIGRRGIGGLGVALFPKTFLVTRRGTDFGDVSATYALELRGAKSTRSRAWQCCEVAVCACPDVILRFRCKTPSRGRKIECLGAFIERLLRNQGWPTARLCSQIRQVYPTACSYTTNRWFCSGIILQDLTPRRYKKCKRTINAHI